jgi:hypothetical protein
MAANERQLIITQYHLFSLIDSDCLPDDLKDQLMNEFLKIERIVNPQSESDGAQDRNLQPGNKIQRPDYPFSEG